MGKWNQEKRREKLKPDFERCVQAMIQADFNRSAAAKILNIERKTLYNKFKAFKKAGLTMTTEAV